MLFDHTLFDFSLIAQGKYPIGVLKLCGAIPIGFFSWAEQNALTNGLTEVKNATAASFINIGLIMGFLTDVLYYNRQSYWTEYAGITLIIVFNSVQGFISQKDHKEKDESQMNDAES